VELMRIGNRFFNMANLIEADMIDAKGGGHVLVLKFVAPMPASVGASDWTVEPYEVRLTGENATAAFEWLFVKSDREIKKGA
jgi:hypothetical protein